VQLVSKISNLCDHKSPTSQTDGRTDRQTDRQTDGQIDGRHAIPRPRICTKEHCAVKMAVFFVRDTLGRLHLLEKLCSDCHHRLWNSSQHHNDHQLQQQQRQLQEHETDVNHEDDNEHVYCELQIRSIGNDSHVYAHLHLQNTRAGTQTAASSDHLYVNAWLQSRERL